MADIEKLGVECLPHVRVVKITKDNVTYLNQGNQQRTILADNIIVTSGTQSDLALADELSALDIEVLSVGDCNGVSYIEGAIHEGYKVGSQI